LIAAYFGLSLLIVAVFTVVSRLLSTVKTATIKPS